MLSRRDHKQAPKHIGQGKHEVYNTQPFKSKFFALEQAFLIAVISAWAVQSLVRNTFN